MSAEDYRARAAHLQALAQRETGGVRAQYEALARSYLVLAEQAEKNSKLDVSYETPVRDPDLSAEGT